MHIQNKEQMTNKPLVVVVVGPTASGKSTLAIEIAKKINGEIISADSMQIYKEMTIATAKVTADEMQGIEHHLIDFLQPYELFSVAQYKELANKAIEEILCKKKTPIIVGGTGLYIDTVAQNTSFIDFESSDERQKLFLRAEKEGLQSLWEELNSVDSETASRIHMNDEKRIIRALELYYATGKTMTEQRELSHLEESEYNFVFIGLTAKDRQFLYNRINSRVDSMLEMGLVDEAKQFFSHEYSKTAKQAIGYKELKLYLDGTVSLEEATEKLKMETRRYAKRQLSWFRRNENIHWLNIDELSNNSLIENSLEIISAHKG